jgi:phosphonate transport system ATP-binding protein
LQAGTVVYDGPSSGVDRKVLTQIYGDEDWSTITQHLDRARESSVSDPLKQMALAE